MRLQPRTTRDSPWHSRAETGIPDGRAATKPVPPEFNHRGATVIDNSYYSQEIHGPYELHDIGNLELGERGTIRNCQLAYATFGTLNAVKDNAILVPTWYSGTNNIIEQVFVGNGRALDPDKYLIIVVNQIGNGLSTSPHNTPPPSGPANFPCVRIGDDVRAQHKANHGKIRPE